MSTFKDHIDRLGFSESDDVIAIAIQDRILSEVEGGDPRYIAKLIDVYMKYRYQVPKEESDNQVFNFHST